MYCKLSGEEEERDFDLECKMDICWGPSLSHFDLGGNDCLKLVSFQLWKEL